MNYKAYLEQLPDAKTLKQICKGRAVIDWIICGHEFETYHTYYKSKQEEYDGSEAQIGFGFEEEDGTSLSIYFIDKACIIVPSTSFEDTKEANNQAFEKKIPKVFLPYYRKNFSDTDIPFVIWTLDGVTWQGEENFEIDEKIEKFAQLTTDPKVYKTWAVDFFGDDTFLKPDMSEKTISDIYQGKVLTESMVFTIVSEVHDWVDLEDELDEIPYRFDF
ncbi:conserved hypothetical protein [Capnocytophaga canimorsus]|uniref:Uncharacterized protein n=1 Tax=Capnocytophaga canimorsus TaxID=28188 RepID=A0A0B7HNE8_9FLAO|nr:hypothetical protein [Capnocytophaga canimorsus]ATA76754.1 hypothetical protein CGC47_03735 [Capnocytophaga canimorsus]ATA93474.1 hypothetical protein CGC54_03550 [Capnocytophaga canimorsus]PJI84126.1 hypothetical protein CLV61_0744 [Capnocytophaga canimorsus]CEN40805.1 conserved hypothetical protein [Capnocytophaga canimorsus]STA71947.1 Uncharacterised protein [Capnocytophaga canimorsus]